MMITNRMKPALAVTAMLLLLTSATALANQPVKAPINQKAPAMTERQNADGTITLEGVLEWSDLEGGFYKLGEWSLMGDVNQFSAMDGRQVQVTGTIFDGVSSRMTKSLVVSQISLKEQAASNQNGVISLEGRVEFVELEGGYYKVGEWSLMGEFDFSAYQGKDVRVTGREFDGVSIRMVKSLVVSQIAEKGAVEGEDKKELRQPVVIGGAISMEGTIEYVDLEGGFYAVDGVGLIGDEALFKSLLGQRALVRGKEFTGVSIRQVPQVEVSSVMLPVSANRSLPTEISVGSNKLPAGQEAAVIDGVLYLPLRHVVQSAGGKVEWNAKEQMVVVTMPDRMAYFKVGEIEAEMNENNVRYLTRNMIKMAKAPVIMNGRTMISADAATYILGLYEVAGTNTSLDLAPAK